MNDVLGYTQSAIDDELAKMPSLPYIRPGHPSSPLYASMVRVASLAKMAQMNHGTVGTAVVRAAMEWAAVHKTTTPPREFWRQWRNAWRYATARKREG